MHTTGQTPGEDSGHGPQQSALVHKLQAAEETDPKACSTKMYDIQPCAGVLSKPYTGPNFSRSHCRNSTELVENLKNMQIGKHA